MELEYQNYPKFTPEMKKTHKILIPNMAPVQFRILAAVMRQAGYTCELLENCGSQVSELGLKYVHNDTCYPALLVIGQFLDALGSGKYDLDHTALIITQTGGGCRASNYIHLLRKALVKAGYPQVPVVSLNFSGLEKDSGFPMTLPLMRKLLACIYYGDLLVTLKAQTEPYETHKGDAAALQEKWLDTICGWVMEDKGWSGREIKAAMPKIAADFAAIPVHRVPKVKVGVVGEIYVKYSPLGNNDLEKFLASQDCEVNLPGLMGFVQYCVANMAETVRLYGGSKLLELGSDTLMSWLTVREKLMIAAIKKHPQFHAPTLFLDTKKMADGIIGIGNKMGEGWLLTAEMMELQQTGFENIICAQPFGCLPNHICGKGMINKIRIIYPRANITPIDYDPGATRVNQENRIKLMLSVAKERLGQSGGTPPQGGAAEKVPVYGGMEVPAVHVPGFAEKLPANG